MNSHIPVFQLFLLGCLILSSDLIAQEDTVRADTWVIETRDGNEFTGVILSEDQGVVVLRTSVYGDIKIPGDHIKSRTQLQPQSFVDGEYWFSNPHSTRYFFGPNGYGLEKGEGYYQNTWILFNQVNYGLFPNFSIGGGIVPLFLFAGAPTPVFITPKVTVPVVKEKLNVGMGGLFAYVLGEGVGFGLPYGTISVGSRENNLAIGAGWGFGENGWTERPTIMFSGMIRVGKKGYLLTENYYIGLGEGDSFGILSAGGRSVQKRLAIDYGLFFPVGLGIGTFVAIPWLGITVPFGISAATHP
jgi:hypothetical protein